MTDRDAIELLARWVRELRFRVFQLERENAKRRHQALVMAAANRKVRAGLARQLRELAARVAP